VVRAYAGEKKFLRPLLLPVERLVYRLTGVDPDAEVSLVRNLCAAVTMTTVGSGSLTAMLMTQKWLPLNSQAYGNLSWHLTFNAAW
jgi:K+-transporting ATPase ATPase A chain